MTAPELRVGSEDRISGFLSAMMPPKAGAFLIDEYGCGHGNAKAFDLVPAERIAEVGSPDPEKFLETGNFLKPIPKEFDEKYVSLWEKVTLGM